MIYEPYKRKKAPRRKRGFLRFLFKALVAVFVLTITICGALYALPVSMLLIEPQKDLSLSGDLPANYINVLLLGVDKENNGTQRTDSIIIASISQNSVKLTSVLRDTVVDIPGHGNGRINAAYVYGGPELVMRTLNGTFEMNIMNYIVVDFASLVKIVDALGGVNIDISEKEMEQINVNVWDTGKIFAPLGYTYEELTTYGKATHLSGLQALGYARIRKIDSDFTRTSRQRILISAMLGKLKANIYNPVVLTRLLSATFGAVDTNLSAIELGSIGMKALFSGEFEQSRLPVDGSYKDDGSTLTLTSIEKNVQAFRAFVYD